jgi:hypothetical protein
VRLREGSRRCASANPAVMTAGMSLVMELVSHLPVAAGAGAGGRGWPEPAAGRVMMSVAVRGTGAQS